MKYFAFISYSSNDLKWGKRLQRKLEGFRLPSSLGQKIAKGNGPIGYTPNKKSSRPLRPIFFAPTDIQPGVLSEELKKRLKESRNLIVICSPSSAVSKWVGLEIEYFVSLGRQDDIYYFIVDGSPDPSAYDTCINPVVGRLGLPEKLGVNVNDGIYKCNRLNRERAYLQLISRFLNVDFDVLWKREKRRFVSRIVIWTISILLILTFLVCAYLSGRPVEVEYRLQDSGMTNRRLPTPDNITIRLFLENETRTDSLKILTHHGVFPNIPRKFLGREARIRVDASYYLVSDTTLILDLTNNIILRRDPEIFGQIYFRIWDSENEIFVENAKVSLNGNYALSNGKGEVKMEIPLEEQDVKYRLEIELADSRMKIDTLYMPTNEYSIISIE